MKIGIINWEEGIIKSILDSFSYHFKLNGHQVYNIDLGEEFIFTQKIVNELNQFKPDFIICYGFHGMTKASLLRKMGLKLVLLFFDNPFLGLSSERLEEIKNYPEYYYSFVFDEIFLNLLKEKDIKNCSYIMHALDTTKFVPQDEKTEDNFVSFVGNIDSDLANEKVGYELIDSLMQRSLSMKFNHLHKGLFEILNMLFKTKKYSAFEEYYHTDNVSFWRSLYAKIDFVGTHFIRIKVLESIKNNIHVYSTKHISLKNCTIHSSIEHGQAISQIYKKSTINVNISDLQLETSLNNRFFDVFGSKGFLLSDYKEDLNKIVPELADAISYKNVSELNKKIDYYISKPNERKEICEHIYNIIIKGHTYEKRTKEILETLTLNKFI